MRRTLAWIIKTALLAVPVAFAVVYATLGLEEWMALSSDSPVFQTDHSGWSAVEGTVTSFSRDKDVVTTAVLNFEYDVGGAKYKGFQAWLSGGGTYASGERVTILYDPANPRVSVVERDKSKVPLASVVFLIVLGVIAAIAFLVAVAIFLIHYRRNFRFGQPKGNRVKAWEDNLEGSWIVASMPVGLIAAFEFFGLAKDRSETAVFLAMTGFFLIATVILIVTLIVGKVKYDADERRHRSGMYFGAHM